MPGCRSGFLNVYHSAHVSEQMSFKISSLTNVNAPWNSKPSYKFFYQNIGDGLCFMILCGICFRPFCEVVFYDQYELTSSGCFWYWLHDIESKLLHILYCHVSSKWCHFLPEGWLSSLTYLTLFDPFLHQYSHFWPIL